MATCSSCSPQWYMAGHRKEKHFVLFLQPTAILLLTAPCAEERSVAAAARAAAAERQLVDAQVSIRLRSLARLLTVLSRCIAFTHAMVE